MMNMHSTPAPLFRVLLVEEDVPTAHEVVESFSHAALDCHHVSGVHDVNEFQQTLTKVNPQLILFDHTPDARAEALLTKIYHACHVPIILLTHEENIGASDGFSRFNVDDYVLKPIDARLLTLRVIAFLRRHELPEKRPRETRRGDWLPYGWASCQGCGYRGHVESFVRVMPHFELSLSECITDAPRAVETGTAPPPEKPRTSAQRVAGDAYQAVLSCPRCGRIIDARAPMP